MPNLSFKTASLLVYFLVFSSFLHAQEGKYVTSSDKLVKVSIPADWAGMSLNEGAVLQYGSESKAAYLLIINDTKEDIEGWNIKKHSFITLAKLLSGVSSPVIEGPMYITVNGFQGIQYIVKGAVSGQMIVYLHTTFETPYTFSQLLTWTVPSQYEKNKLVMDGIINSFKSAK